MVKRILVTGAGGPAGINFTKSLKIASERMILIGTEANCYYATLAETSKTHVIPRASDSRYLDRLNEVIKEERVELVYPQPDAEVMTISEFRDKLDANTFLPSREAVRICQDKLESANQWRRKGVPVPRTVFLKTEADVEQAFEELGTPLWIRARRGAGGRGSTPVSNPEAATNWIDYWKSRKMVWEFIAQEFLPGRNIGFHSIWKDGALVTSMARERLQYIYPYLAPSGITGTPSVQRTIHDSNVNKTACQAVLAIDECFNGIACVDLRENEEGIPYVTEINAGRMFTTSFFFSYASKKLFKNYWANFPYLYIRLAFREEVPNIPEFNVLPEDLYWIRHMDAPARLLKADKIIGKKFR